MRQEELWEWRIKWLGQWTSTIHGVTEAEIRKIHPEAIRVLGSRCVRQIAETPDDLKLLMGPATNARLLAQISFSLNGAFWPTSLPLFHGSREDLLDDSSMTNSLQLKGIQLSCVLTEAAIPIVGFGE